MRTGAWVALLLCLSGGVSAVQAEDAKPAETKAEEGFVTILDAKSFKDWKVFPGKAAFKVEETDDVKKFEKGQWSFKEGVLHGEGDVSHIFSPREDYENLHIKADVKISDKGNGGMYFRVARGNGFPKGYEAQINSSHGDPKRTGSLYNFFNVAEQLVPPDTWFKYEVIATGNHIVIKVNDKVCCDYTDAKNSFAKGGVAFQQHNLGSEVWVKNLMVKDLPATPAAPAPAK